MHTLHDPHALDTLAKFVRAVRDLLAMSFIYILANYLLV